MRTTLDPTILNADDVAQIRATVTSMGVTDVVVQEVRTDGASEAFVENLARYRRAHPGASSASATPLRQPTAVDAVS